MRRVATLLGILYAAVSFADPPATAVVPEPPSSSAQTPATPAVSPPPSDEQMQKLLSAQGYKPTMIDGEKRYCRRETPTGSHLTTTLKCVTVAEAKLMAKEGRDTTERIQHRSPDCFAPGAQHGAVQCH